MGPSARLRAAPWVAGIALALLVLGPALAPGSLLNLDLVFTPTIPVPRGVWALGPELSRRVPLGAALAWASTLIGGALTGKLLLGGAIAVAFAGAWRLLADTGVPARLGAGLLYAGSPFTLTRVAVGHWGVVAALAVLPWALPVLLRPGDDVGRTWTWSVVIGATGVTGGMFAAVLVVCGLVADRGRRAAKVGPLFLVAQLPWLIPGIFTVGPAGPLSNPRHYATDASVPFGALRVLAGGGFWRTPSQIGARGAGGALLGAALLVLALVGARHLPARWRGRAAAAAAVGAALALASGLPGVRSLFADLTTTTFGGALRDSQRLLGLYLAWMAPAAALGAARLASQATPAIQPTIEVLPAVAGIVLAAPGLLGAGGALEPVRFPSGWAEARAQVQRAPGPVLALPWHEYLNLGFADGRRVLNPVPDYFGGDVLVSSNPEFADSPNAREQGDPREEHVPPLLGHLDGASASLRALGVRWVVLLHEVDWRADVAINRDPGMERTVSTPAVDLYQVRDWRGPVAGDRGRPLAVHTVVAPWSWVSASGAATWDRPAASGWLRGTSATSSTAMGLLRLPAGRGPVWYWPAALALGADAIVVAGVGWVAWAALRRRHTETVDNPTVPLPD
ncbi:MAG: hypothetical protein JO265_11585 [Acidimicrobiia bacterium]|nr:hypothetical protein [Acidimicrobiia bacterium]